MSGFGWDDGRKLVIAADEQWAELAKVCSRIDSINYMLTVPVYRRARRSKNGRRHHSPSMTRCIHSLMVSLLLGPVHSRQEPHPHPNCRGQLLAKSLQLNGLRIANQLKAQLLPIHYPNKTQCVASAH